MNPGQNKALGVFEHEQIVFRFPECQETNSWDTYSIDCNSGLDLFKKSDDSSFKSGINSKSRCEDSFGFKDQAIYQPLEFKEHSDESQALLEEEKSCFPKIGSKTTGGLQLCNIPEKGNKIIQNPIPIADHLETDDGQRSSDTRCSGGKVSQYRSYFLEVLDKEFFDKLYARQISSNRRRGRPRKLKNTDPEVIWREVLGNLTSKANKREDIQRTDSKNTSVYRDAKRVVDHILKYFESKCRYKSANLKLVIESYAEAFIIGFVPTVFGGQTPRNKVRTFCEFIILGFSQKKVKQIISKVAEAGLLSIEECEILNLQLKKRKDTSKANFQKLVKENSCFRRIILELLSKPSYSDMKDPEKYMNILEAILDP
ncbi:unnamed protein product [Moneuplotes crassus]|uniref:Uncharacterized protein n=1 Tax=Euplotes crassus TaxID=5936 RepID=A0AAD1UNF6_EUPCR|nr:unnamed protein product [Moneuplotes crassus]